MAPQLQCEPSSVYPVTPSKKGLSIAEFDIWFLEFSNSYNLNLRRTPPGLSPQKKRALSYYSELQYYELLKTQYFKGRHTVIRDLFDHGAKEIHSKWVKKPHAGPDVVPFPTKLPRATTEPERRELLKLLRAILDDINGSANISSCSSVAAYDEPLSPTKNRRPECHSNEWQGSPSRTTKSAPSDIDTEFDPDDERSPSVLSALDRGRVYTASPVPSQTSSTEGLSDSRFSRTENPYGSGNSVNTSQSIFGSRPAASQETQTTIIASNSESLKLPILRNLRMVGSDSDSLAPSSSTERHLQAALDNHEQLQRNPRGFPRQEPTTYSYSSGLDQRTTRSITRSPPSQSSPVSSHIVLPPPAFPPALPTTPPTKEETDGILPHVRRGSNQYLEQRLYDVWPQLPRHYDQAPFVVRWEILRIALYCGIQMDELRSEYDSSWNDQNIMWARLQALPIFQGKTLPEKSRPEAWAAALNEKFGTTGETVVLTASLTANTSKKGPLFFLRLNSLKLDLPHRLSRRFGSDRFLELVIPAMGSQDVKNLGESAIDIIQQWLINGPHELLGRVWASFFVKPTLPRKINSENALGPQPKVIHQERVYLFAEDGNDFRHLGKNEHWSAKGEAADMHTRMNRRSLIDWLLQVPNNQKQSVLKLFSRIALGLSRTYPTVILRPEQIRHRDKDILSPTGKVMNDGIARMSRGLARAISDSMGLQDLPAGFQGRFGCAKGFWIRDTTDTSDEIWIETYPSQRKWVCDYIEDDHRTFEVRNESKELKSASLNLQLLPILEDRAIDRALMKAQVGKFMKDSLMRDLDAQKAAMQDPIQFRLWVYENSPSARREERVKLGQIPFSAGLPTSREDVMSFLLDSGFDPTRLEFLSEIAWKLRREKCQELQERLNVRVGRSTYAYMVVDFLGVLEEDEVHLGFSSKFTDEQSGFSETLLHGIDVLVARTPAHYPSDIQRVKAVFKPELGSLKDVVIFPTKGKIPLAEKLSGGDYDGDIAWVCWDPLIVNNFRNARMPDVPDLFQRGILRKENSSYADLVGVRDITTEFLARAFKFNLQQNLLGMCTNYKEKLCYERNSVQDDPAILLSTLISHLVDRAKQGTVFTEQDWARLRRRLRQGDPPEPQYKKNSWGGQGEPTHIIDYVKFRVGIPTIETELGTFKKSISGADKFDKDLVRFYQSYEKYQRPYNERKDDIKKRSWEKIIEQLQKDIDQVAEEWPRARGEWDAKLAHMYEKWQSISPTDKVKSETVQSLLRQEDLAGVGFSNWDLLKASFLFKMYYRKFPKFVWYIGGKQLAYLKALYTSRNTVAPPVFMVPNMYAGSRPDKNYARALAGRTDGRDAAGGELIDEDKAASLSDDDF